MPKTKIWSCKIGEVSAATMVSDRLSDHEMRKAVTVAFQELTGREPDFIFSGWDGELTASERRTHENTNDLTPENYNADLNEWLEKGLELGFAIQIAPLALALRYKPTTP